MNVLSADKGRLATPALIWIYRKIRSGRPPRSIKLVNGIFCIMWDYGTLEQLCRNCLPYAKRIRAAGTGLSASGSANPASAASSNTFCRPQTRQSRSSKSRSVDHRHRLAKRMCHRSTRACLPPAALSQMLWQSPQPWYSRPVTSGICRDLSSGITSTGRHLHSAGQAETEFAPAVLSGSHAATCWGDVDIFGQVAWLTSVGARLLGRAVSHWPDTGHEADTVAEVYRRGCWPGGMLR